MVVFISSKAPQVGRKMATKVAAPVADGGGNPNCLRGFAPDTNGSTMVVLVLPLGKQFSRKRREKQWLGFFSGGGNSGNGSVAPRDGAGCSGEGRPMVVNVAFLMQEMKKKRRMVRRRKKNVKMG